MSTIKNTSSPGTLAKGGIDFDNFKTYQFG